LERLQTEEFQAVLMDCQLPGLDGFEVTRRIRENERRAGTATSDASPRLPIVAVTAGATKEDRQRCQAAGMDGFVSKPIDRARLLAILDSLLTTNHAPVAEPEQPPTDDNAAV